MRKLCYDRSAESVGMGVIRYLIGKLLQLASKFAKGFFFAVHLAFPAILPTS